MKGKIILFALIFLLMLLLPLLSIHSSPTQEPTPTSSQKSDPTQKVPPQAAKGGSFRILDQTSKKVITVPDKEFLYGTVATEISPLSQPEALKAQAVAAYTYYSRLRAQEAAKEKGKQSDSDFSATTGSWLTYVSKKQMQERWGEQFDSYYQKLTSAVDEVYGQVLLANGSLIDATYYAISSGKTENSEDIWGGKTTYLVSVASPGDVFAGGYQTTVAVKKDAFTKAIKTIAPQANLSGEPTAWIGSATRTAAGSVKTISIGGKEVEGSAVRSAFNLRSANFTVAYKEDTFTFTVKGYGHGVGMSQTGALYMANQGANYKEILTWYYPNTTLSTLTDKK